MSETRAHRGSRLRDRRIVAVRCTSHTSLYEPAILLAGMNGTAQRGLSIPATDTLYILLLLLPTIRSWWCRRALPVLGISNIAASALVARLIDRTGSGLRREAGELHQERREHVASTL